ncbi:lasso peptide biosynthesis B2 protein [Streptomyces rubiginosohelvolus]|uniref:lasso peptide biosynthesis B2 protein n=1 Tax=Streptomyces rubiginosohelvolus TaxID=67362 RepID=UPI003646A96B
MSAHLVPESGIRLTMREQIPARTAVAAARLLALLSPRRIRRILNVLRRGARPAGLQDALTARTAVVSVSTRCAGEGCLQRSLATVILCRMAGCWPQWCAGVRTQPLRAHAWVEAEGVAVGEPYPANYFRLLLRVPACRPNVADGEKSVAPTHTKG